MMENLRSGAGSCELVLAFCCRAPAQDPRVRRQRVASRFALTQIQPRYLRHCTASPITSLRGPSHEVVLHVPRKRAEQLAAVEHGARHPRDAAVGAVPQRRPRLAWECLRWAGRWVRGQVWVTWVACVWVIGLAMQEEWAGGWGGKEAHSTLTFRFQRVAPSLSSSVNSVPSTSLPYSTSRGAPTAFSRSRQYSRCASQLEESMDRGQMVRCACTCGR